MKLRRLVAGTSTLAVAATLGVTLGAATSPARAADAADPIAEFLFTSAPADNTTVPNTVAGSGFGSAKVNNSAAGLWTDNALTLSGGAKTSTGDWVELPDGLLNGQDSATVITEVKADATMLNSFHFLWNIGNESSATEYFFASLNCGNGRTPLLGVKASASEHLVQSGSCSVTANRWVSVAAVVDDSGSAPVGRLYLDGVKVAEGAITATPADVADQSLNTIGRAPWPDPLFKGAVSTFRVYDQALDPDQVAAVSATDAAIHGNANASAILTGLALTDKTVASESVALPTAGGKVTWTSSDPEVIGTDGTVNQPSLGEDPVAVTMTATATDRGFSASQQVTYTVQPSTLTDAERLQIAADGYVVPPSLASGQALPTLVGQASVALAATGISVDPDGTVTASGESAVSGTVTATISLNGLSTTRRFEVSVLPDAAGDLLLGYHRTPTSASQANNADVAYSMHLALEDGGTWNPLNENYGIFFPKTASVPAAGGTSSTILRNLVDPMLFTTTDGGYGVVATRTLWGGAADTASDTSVLVATSDDLLSFDEVGMVDVGETNGVNDPYAVRDTEDDTYLVAWTDDNGVARHTTFDTLAVGATHGPVVTGKVARIGEVDEADIDNFNPGYEVPVTTAVADALQVRYGRITNTGYEPYADLNLVTGSSLDAGDLPTDVDLTYSDGSTGSLPVATWDTSAVDTSTPGTYPITGTVKQTEYPVPFADERADPSVYKYAYEVDGQTRYKYLMIATNDIYGDNINQQGSAFMPVRVADTISELSDEAGGAVTEIHLLDRGDTDAKGATMTGCFWAPEFHTIAGRLSILFMPCYGSSPDMWTGRASIMQLKQDGAGVDLDPADPDNWTKPTPVTRADGSQLNQLQNISLDMTYFVDEAGQSYYVWQQLGSIFIATMDPADPTRLTSTPVRIIAPEYAWDNLIAEGPNVHIHDGKLFLIYSGSSVGNTYTTGLATADASGATPLTDPAAWTKLNYPIQKSGPFNGSMQLGTGHGMWSEDEDGQLIYVFHAATSHNGLTGRDMFVRRVHWAADGLPVFDMEADEELASETVTMNVVVAAPAKATSRTTLTIKPTRVRLGAKARATVTATVKVAVDGVAKVATGKVRLTWPKGHTKVVTVRKGAASVKLTFAKVGRYPVRAAYLGTGSTEPSTSRKVVVRVVR